MRVSLFVLIFVSMAVFNCGKSSAKDKNGELNNNEQKQRINYDSSFGKSFDKKSKKQWQDLKVSDLVVNKVAQKYLGKTYSVIWKGDTDADGILEYFIVVKDRKYYHAASKGIIVDKKGIVKFRFNRQDGFYDLKYGSIFNFNKIGLKKNDVMAVKILFSNSALEINKKKSQYIIKNKLKDKLYVPAESFKFELIDYSGCLILVHFNENEKPVVFSEFIIKSTDYAVDNIKTWYSVETGPDSYKKYYKRLKKVISLYRKNKAKGIVVRAINAKL